MHGPVLIHYRKRVAHRTHPARARDVRVGGRLPQQPPVKGFVALQIVFFRLNASPQHGSQVWHFRHFQSQADAGPQPLTVEWFGQVVVVHGGLFPGVSRGQSQFASAFGEQKANHHFDIPLPGVIIFELTPRNLRRHAG